nr:uncharacterized protein LOC127347060 [Lolium perenne]
MPLADIILNRAGRVAKWAFELGVHNITYEPRRAVKSQALADFFIEWEEAQQPTSPADLKHWILYFDGSKKLEAAGAGIVLISPKGDTMRYVLQQQFEPCTNNMAEYQALLHGMRIAKEMGATRLHCFGDSDLVASQTAGTCDATDGNMIAYKRAVNQAGASFTGHVVEWVDRRKNEEADALSRLGNKRQPPPPGVFFDNLTHPSVRRDAKSCATYTQGDCGHHAGARLIVTKAFRHGFYWLTTHADAVQLVRACVGCQKYASQSHMPGSALKTIPITWPFAVCCMDMVRKFKTAPGGYTHLLIAVDKFTKWVEEKPIKKCDGKTATKFPRELIYRYGYPHNIITDNGTNFAKGEMADFCEENGIRLDLALVAHPESNGQAERANQSILHGIKPRLEVPLESAARCWAEELPSVLWGIRTTPNRSTGYTPFFLVYGAEAVMPTDIDHDSPRVVNYAEEENELARQEGFDHLDEERDLTLSRMAIYLQGLRRYHSRRVCSRSFQEGDLVLRLIHDKKDITVHHTNISPKSPLRASRQDAQLRNRETFACFY